MMLPTSIVTGWLQIQPLENCLPVTEEALRWRVGCGGRVGLLASRDMGTPLPPRWPGDARRMLLFSIVSCSRDGSQTLCVAVTQA